MLLAILIAVSFEAFLPHFPQNAEAPTSLVKQLAGRWHAAEDRTPRVTDLDVKVFGVGAYDLRNVTPTIQPLGDGTLTVSTIVVVGKGRRYVPTVMEAQLQLSDFVTKIFGKFAPTIAVVAAEERYLDGARDRFKKEGSRASISVTGPTASQMEFRFDTPDGRDSFGVTLRRRP
jgi:hypothetical protein